MANEQRYARLLQDAAKLPCAPAVTDGVVTALDKAVQTLAPRHQEAVRLFYGLNPGQEPLRPRQTAELMGVTTGRIHYLIYSTGSCFRRYRALPPIHAALRRAGLLDDETFQTADGRRFSVDGTLLAGEFAFATGKLHWRSRNRIQQVK